jgi:hypothetical protein
LNRPRHADWLPATQSDKHGCTATDRVTHFLQYWTPARAALAFDGDSGPIERLENGYFKTLSADDVLWIVTLAPDNF